MAYSKLFAIHDGDKMVTFAGFSCIAAGVMITVERDGEGQFFRCSDGKHHLSSQVDDAGYCLGLTPLLG